MKKNDLDKEEIALICRTITRFFLVVGAIAAIACEGFYGLLVVGFLSFFYLIVTEG